MCGFFSTLRHVGTVLAVGWIIGSRSGLAAEPLSGGPDRLRDQSARMAEANSAGSGEEAHRPQREFVRAWKINDLRRDLNRIGAGRSFALGKTLFSAANCDQCHRLNRIGGTLGPDLTGVAKRNSRTVILREIIEPSQLISDKYRSHHLITSSGKVNQGLVVRQDADFVYLANDPSKPDQLLKIPVDEIEEKTPLAVSIMPGDLLNTLSREEILDLLAYIEADGRQDHPVYDLVR